jgi:hypothetical protein
MEAEAGIEPAYKGFADPCLTTWLFGLTSCCDRELSSCASNFSI